MSAYFDLNLRCFDRVRLLLGKGNSEEPLNDKLGCSDSITQTHLYKYIEKFKHQKKENFQIKNSDIFQISAQNIDCGYPLEPPRRGGSNEYPQSMF